MCVGCCVWGWGKRTRGKSSLQPPLHTQHTAHPGMQMEENLNAREHQANTLSLLSSSLPSEKIAGASLLVLEEKVGCELCVSIYIYISSSYSRIEKRLDVMHLLLLFLTAFFLLSFGNVKKFSPHNKIRRKSFFLEDLKYLYACLYMFLYVWIICKVDELYTLYNRMKAWRVLTLRIRINRSTSGGGVCIVIILF